MTSLEILLWCPCMGADRSRRKECRSGSTGDFEELLTNARTQVQSGSADDFKKLSTNAQTMYGIYNTGFAFPKWSLDMLQQENAQDYKALAEKVTVYYRQGDSKEDVQLVATEREPVNIAMGRHYNRMELQRAFGYSEGAYKQSSKDKLMPNIAIYCHTEVRQGDRRTKAHVINVIGYAFDSPAQPDYQYFLPCSEEDGKWKELVGRFSQMWSYIFQCAADQGLKYVFLADVGGGAFSDGLRGNSPGYASLKEASQEPVLKHFSHIEVRKLPRMPDFAFSEEGQKLLPESLLVNAWDPWSMVGNGNAMDNSLDGFFGRCTSMGILCWPHTNPWMKCREVDSWY